MTQIVSSISGIEIYAPSAGNAPTNSSEVSAIASAYQVVSATSTQLYAGTAYLTGVNSAPISAARAGNAANATQATSAWYDGTGRLISALPDSAAVSAIASGYASGKVDKSTISAQSSKWNSVYNTVNLNSASWSGGTGGGSVVSPSGTILVNGSNIEGTNSAAVLQQTAAGFLQYLQKINSVYDIGPRIQQITYNSVDETGANLKIEFNETAHNPVTIIISGRDSTYTTQSASSHVSVGDSAASIPLGFIVQGISASASEYLHFPNGYSYFTAEKPPESAIVGIGELAWQSALTGVSSTVATYSAGWGGGVPASTVSSIASSYASSAVSGVESAVSANSATWNNTGVSEATVSSIASSYAESAASGKADSSSLSSYALSADVSGTIDTVSANSATWGQGGVITATASGKVSTTGISSLNGSSIIARALSDAGHILIGSSDAGMYLTGGTNGGTAYYKSNEMVINRSSYGEQVKFNLGSAGSQVYGSASGDRGAFIQMSNDYHRAFLGALSGKDGIIELDGYSANSASMYAWDGVVDTVSSNSASWGQGGVDSATVSSIASSYAQDVSAAVSGTVDTVSSQSANWGGSALALSAGPGVKLEKVGDTLVAGLDESVLWSGTTTNITGITLNETYGNFDRVRFYWKPWTDAVAWHVTEIPSFALVFTLDAGWASNAGTGKGLFMYSISSNGTEFSQLQGGYQNITGSNTWSSATNCSVVKVVGVNRTAGV